MVQLDFFNKSHGLTGRISFLSFGLLVLRTERPQGDIPMPPQFWHTHYYTTHHWFIYTVYIKYVTYIENIMLMSVNADIYIYVSERRQSLKNFYTAVIKMLFLIFDKSLIFLFSVRCAFCTQMSVLSSAHTSLVFWWTFGKHRRVVLTDKAIKMDIFSLSFRYQTCPFCMHFRFGNVRPPC